MSSKLIFQHAGRIRQRAGANRLEAGLHHEEGGQGVAHDQRYVICQMMPTFM